MSGITLDEANRWRREATIDLGANLMYNIKCVNPCNYYNYENAKNATPLEIKMFDLCQVKSSDLILVNLDNPDSIGTAIELQIAYDMSIPIIGFGTAKNHDWIELCITKRFDKLEDATDYILAYYYSAR